MAEVTRVSVSIEVKARITLELDEEEARALSGIFGYEVDHFLRVFYREMGSSYVKPYEDGVRRLHDRIRGILSGPLCAVDEAKKVIRMAEITPR